jgi:serine/threonine-protein kinase
MNAATGNDHPAQRDEHDSRLAAVLEDLCARVRAGESVDIERCVRNHPELAGEIRGLWATVQFADDFAPGFSPIDSDLPASATENRFGRAAQPGREFGDYELLEELGRGGMGVVYRARQRSLSRIVALKMILREGSAPGEAARFRAEAEAAAQLDHPNVVPVFEVGEVDGAPFFSMRCVDGETLAQRIARGPLPAREAAEILVPVCRAVADAHRRGVLHRDLKPSNILIDYDGTPFVTDFGLAKRIAPVGGEIDGSQASIASLTHSGAVLGTPGYMAPEQAAGDRGEVGPATDVYALGAILYAMLTGRAPFQAASPIDVVLMLLEQDPPPPRLLVPSVDSDLELIALKSLQKPTDLRYAGPDDLAEDLERFLRHEPITARSSHFSQVLSRALRPTHHAAVLENWGLLWMWHALVVLSICVVTNLMQSTGVESRWAYAGWWTLGLGTWAAIFWNLRRRAGPVTFVERQIAHIWAASMAISTGLFGVEALLGLEPLSLSPVLALVAAGVFVAKAGILSGEFYIHAAALFLAAIPMSLFPGIAISVFGLVSGAAFFIPGLKFYAQQRRMSRAR